MLGVGAPPCDARWLDLLCDALAACAEGREGLDDPVRLRNKLLPALKFLSLGDFVRAVGKIAKMKDGDDDL